MAQQEAALSSSGGAAGGAPAAAASLLQRLVAAGGLADRGTLLLAAALGGAVLLGAAEPAAAAEGSTHWAHTAAQPLGDLAENADFWGNVVRYISYFFSVLLGTAYIAVKPIIGLLKRPGTAVLVVAGLAGLVYFVSFTVQVRTNKGSRGRARPLSCTATCCIALRCGLVLPWALRGSGWSSRPATGSHMHLPIKPLCLPSSPAGHAGHQRTN